MTETTINSFAEHPDMEKVNGVSAFSRTSGAIVSLFGSQAYIVFGKCQNIIKKNSAQHAIVIIFLIWL